MAGGRFGGGGGTSTSPYLIEDADDLNAMRKDLSSFYKLVNNINLGVSPYNTGSGWLPIQGNFLGGLDGNGKAIMNLYINRPTTDNIGLFSIITGGNGATSVTREVVKDITFINPNITGQDFVGTIAGKITLGSALVGNKYFERIVIKNGNVTGRSAIGGFAGIITGGFSTGNWYISDCKIECNISHSGVNTSGNGCGVIVAYCTGSGYSAQIQRVICSGIVSSTLASPTYAQADVGEFASTTFTNVFYNSTISTKPGRGTAKTDTELKTVSTYSGYAGALIARHGNSSLDAKNAWTFSAGRFATLYSENQNKLFILKNGTDYQTWNGSGWVTKYTALPTREEFILDGMSSLDAVTLAGWDALKTYTSVQIVNLVDESKGVTLASNNHSLTLDTSGVTRNIFKKTITTSTLGNGINKIKNV